MMTLINNKLLTESNGLTKLGYSSILSRSQFFLLLIPTFSFINPTLYTLPPQAFLDIITGENNCGEDLDSCCPYGFPATAGWDAVTGFGSPYFPAFYSML